MKCCKPTICALLITVLSCLSAAERISRPAPAAVEDHIAVFFSPDGGCTDAIVTQLNAAKHTIDVQAYSFTSTAIAKAMGEAHDRGVKVRAVLDRSEEH